MSLLSSHRLHWGSHHELTDHFWIIVDHLIHPPAPAASSPGATTPPVDGGTPGQSPTETANARLDALGP